jgi:hypothetical protein
VAGASALRIFSAHPVAVWIIVARYALSPTNALASTGSAVLENTIGRRVPQQSITNGGRVDAVATGTYTKNNPAFFKRQRVVLKVYTTSAVPTPGTPRE